MMKKKLFLILILLISLFLLRLPSLFEPYWYGDEGITLTVGQQLNRGLILYKEVVDNKTPLLYFFAAKMITLFNFKLLTLFWVLVTFLFFLKIVSLFTPENEILVSLIFIFLTSTPILEGNIVNGEIYGILPMMVSIYFFWQKFYFLSGLFACFSFLFKHPFLFDFFSLLTFLIFFDQISLKELVLKISKLIAGFFLPLILTIIYFYHQGALRDFFQQAILNNLKYISWQTEMIISQGLTLIKTLVFLLLISFVSKQKTKISKKEAFIFLWLLFSLFGATLSTRPYPHYLLQIVPSFSLLMGIALNPIKIFLLILSFAFAVFQFKLNFSSFSYSLRYYQNFLRGNADDFYSKEVKTTYEIAHFLKKNAGTNEPIFVWSDNTLIYALSQRPPVGKYLAAYHLTDDPDREQETIKELAAHPPRLIILTLPIEHLFPALASFLKEDYNLLKDNVDYQIYQRKNF